MIEGGLNKEFNTQRMHRHDHARASAKVTRRKAYGNNNKIMEYTKWRASAVLEPELWNEGNAMDHDGRDSNEAHLP